MQCIQQASITVASPYPARLRIVGYNPVAVWSTVTSNDGGVAPFWSGELFFSDVGFGAIAYVAGGVYTFNGSGGIKRNFDQQPLITNYSIVFPTGDWQFTMLGNVIPFGPDEIVWQGMLAEASGPAGIYARTAGSDPRPTVEFEVF